MQYTRKECAALQLLGEGHGENTVAGYFEAWIEVRDKPVDELTWPLKSFLRELPAMQAVLEERREKQRLQEEFRRKREAGAEAERVKKQQHARVKELDALGLENLHENQLKEILQILKLQQSLKPEGMVFRDRVIAQLGKIRQMN